MITFWITDKDILQLITLKDLQNLIDTKERINIRMYSNDMSKYIKKYIEGDYYKASKEYFKHFYSINFYGKRFIQNDNIIYFRYNHRINLTMYTIYIDCSKINIFRDI